MSLNAGKTTPKSQVASLSYSILGIKSSFTMRYEFTIFNVCYTTSCMYIQTDDIYRYIEEEGGSASYLCSRSFSCFFKSACSYRILSSLDSTMYISSLRWWTLFSSHAMSEELTVTPLFILFVNSTEGLTCICWGLAKSISMLNCCNKIK